MDSPAGVRTKVKCGSILLDDFVLDFHHGKIEFDLGLGRFGGEIAADNLCEQLTCLLKQIPLHISAIGGTIGMAASLSYIGLGVQPPTPEWGAMLSAGRNFIRDYPHLVIFPGVTIMIAVLALNLFGDGLRDAMDPKLRD